MQLPPLNALRGFDAAARHLSFTRASEELHLTQGAISRQVRQLEQFIGKPLFRRMTRRIELTRDGVAFHEVVARALADIAAGTAAMRAAGPARHLTVSVLPTLSALWLMPRLHDFTSRHPHVEVTTTTSIEPADLRSNDAVVAAIRVGRLPGRRYARKSPRIALEMVTNWQGVSADELFPDVLVPICDQALLQGRSSVDPADLLGRSLIQTSTRPDGWVDWFRAHGVRLQAAPKFDYAFGHFFMSIDAARRGLGIALVPHVIWATLPARGGLVVAVQPPVDEEVSSAGSYCLLIREEHRDRDFVREFRKWIFGEAASIRTVIKASAVAAPVVLS
jgi:LysR family transcriptional regulator, glycine cleavage system transcriptional activator